MKQIKTNNVYEEIINKSRFITLYYQVYSEDEVKEILASTKVNYPNARHYCYAYIIDNIKRCSDDGEPAKTAGMPILNVLENQELNYVLCIIVRYFGGILLGAGGLTRAYASGAANGIPEVVEVEQGHLFELKFNYDAVRQIDYLLRDFEIVDKVFMDEITYTVKAVELPKVDAKIKIIDDCYIEKRN